MHHCRSIFLGFFLVSAAFAQTTRSEDRTVVPTSRSSESLVTEQLNQALRQTWQQHQVQSTPAVDDLGFLRRIWLDLEGRVPPVKETRAVMDAKSPLDRAAVVARLLASDEFGNHWGRLWTEYLTDARPFATDPYNARLLQNYLRDALQKNEPYDQIVRALFVADGHSDTSGPVNFLLRYSVSPPALTGAAAEKFLGVTLKCAECHDHPHSTWKQDDFWGLAAYFARLKRMTPADGGEFSLVVERTRGELEVPDRTAKPNEDGSYPNKAIFPRLPGNPSIDGTLQRRDTFLKWLTANDNPFFARHAVNHVWAMLLGRPLVASFDPPKLNTAAPPSPALDVLVNDFRQHGFDLQRLIRTIVLSEAYQRSAGIHSANESEVDEASILAGIEHFARYPVRPISADQLHLSLLNATGSSGDPNDARLAQLTREEFTYDISVDTFSEPAMTPRRSLALLNGERAREAVSLAADAAIRQFGPAPGVPHIEWLYLCLLSRPPRNDERDRLLELVGASAGAAGLEDAAWVLINSAEFNSNH